MAEDTTLPTAPVLSRRSVVRGATVGGAALPVLVACGGDEEPDAAPAEPSDAGEPADSADGAGGLVDAADVPVGGGVVLEDEQIVVTQPTEGEFNAFTAVCTHQGCIVNSVAEDVISCPCHGSTYSALDGSNIDGPATEPLDEIGVEVSDGQVVRT